MGLQKCENFRQFSVGSRLQKFLFESDNISPRRKLRAFVLTVIQAKHFARAIS